MKRKFCYFYLTCDPSEAEVIAQSLLEKRLIACAKFTPIRSTYWWQLSIEHTDETLIIMESAEDLFSEVKRELATLHSYETFVLTAVEITHINVKAAKWLEENLKEAIWKKPIPSET